MVLNGFYSDYSPIESGVPQGSVLGPLLFLVYINDLERNIKSNVKLFSDDTMLFSLVKDPVTSANELNHDVDMIYISGHTNGKWNLILIPLSRQLKFYFLVKKKCQSPAIHFQWIYK